MMFHFQRHYFQNVTGHGSLFFCKILLKLHMKNCGYKKGLTGKIGFMKCNKEKAKGSLSCIPGINEIASAFHMRISLRTEDKAMQMNSEYVNIPGFPFSVNLF